MNRPFFVSFGVFAAIALAFASPSHAQLSNLDDQQFIRGLRERNMKELVLYFIEKNPPKDPIVRLEIQIEVARLLAQDEKATVKERGEAFDKVRPMYTDLLEQAPGDHWKRSIWTTDLVQWDYESLLRGRHINAADFVELAGLKGSTPEQRKIFLQVAPEDAVLIDAAGIDLRNVIMFAPRERNFQLEWQNSGRWALLQMADTLTLPYYKALALNYAALLDKEAHEQIRAKTGTAFAELLAAADADLERLGRNSDLLPETKAKVLAMHGRIKLRRGDASAALKLLDAALAIKEIAPFEQLTALLVKAHAQAALKQADAAMKTLAEARKTDAAQHPLNIILVYAAEFGVTGDHNAWTKLINDPTIAKDPELQAAVRSFVNKILVDVDSKPGEIDPNAEPQVVMANIDALIAKADPLLAEADAASDPGKKAEFRKRAAAFLDPAAEALNKLIEREKIAPEARAEALNRLGLVYYKQGLRDKAARAWITLAQDHSDIGSAEPAAVNAVVVAQDLYNNVEGAKRNQHFIQLYRDALEVLLAKFPHNDKAKLHTYSYAALLREMGELDAAIEAYARVAEDHPYRADASFELAVVYCERFRQAEDAARQPAAQAAIQALLTADRELRDAARDAKDERRVDALQQKIADETLRRAEVLIAIERYADADGALANFERDFGKYPDLVREARSNRVAILIGLNEAEKAMDEVKRIAAESPATAGPLLYLVIQRINERIVQLSILGRKDEAARLADKSVEIAEELLKWASTQDDLKGNLLPFELTVARQLSQANKHAEAAAVLDKIAAQPGADNNVDVIFGQAEALASVALTQQPPEVDATEDRALKNLNKIIEQTPEDTKFESPIWWRSWALYLTVLDRRWERIRQVETQKDRANRMAGGIYRSVLQLEQFDKYLGRKFDPAISKTLSALKIKHMPK